ncbi:MAG: SufS family cysteine desulfurase [Bacteroidales bacterium]|nr:SufS family cysteine desulfurase [Bacteroidales bacterium]
MSIFADGMTDHITTIEGIRSQFPILDRSVYGKPLVYLDNAATSQRPGSVMDCLEDMSIRHNANIHRAVHALAAEATDFYESARAEVASFLNADASEIVFTSGTTASINLVANSFGALCAADGKSEIIIAESEHHSDIVPWQLLAERNSMSIKVLGVDDNGRLEIEKLAGMLSDRTAIVCVAQVSNVLGLINPIAEIVRIAHSKGVPVLVDGAQGVVHCDVDVKALDCDFYAFSGHKIYASTGTGVLYAKRAWLDAMPPYMGGGEMIDTVKFSGSTYAKAPHKFEAGTQNLNGTPTLVPAIEMLKSMRAASKETEAVKEYVYGSLVADGRIKLYGTTEDLSLKTPIFSFNVDGVHHEDLALILDKMGIAVRSGQMCAEPLMDRYGVTGMLRASFAPYNTMQEAEYFISAIDKAIRMLK